MRLEDVEVSRKPAMLMMLGPGKWTTLIDALSLALAVLPPDRMQAQAIYQLAREVEQASGLRLDIQGAAHAARVPTAAELDALPGEILSRAGLL